MKNIYVIPTNKPSKIALLPCGTLEYSKTVELFKKTVDWKTQNIYITDDSEIKEGDLFIGLQNQISKATNKDIFGGFEKKIILTTDTQLIADGIQSIDDEFLEWFVKNPNCEKVEVKFNNRGITGAEKILKIFGDYQIIIPKEEPTLANMKCTCMRFEANCFSGRCKNCGFPPKEKLSTKLHKGEVVDKSYPEEFKHECKVLSKKEVMEGRSSAYKFIDFDKQETLEEVAEKWNEQQTTLEFGKPHNAPYRVEAFIAGFKACEEQNKNLCSEEEFLAFGKSCFYKGFEKSRKKR